MAKLLKLRRGTTTQHGSFTGAEGEVTIDTTKDTAVVHDGAQAGGRPLAREDMNNVSSSSIVGQITASALAGNKVQPNFGTQDIETTGNIDLSDSTGSGNNRIKLGTGDDLELYHNGTRSEIINNTGDLIIQASANNNLLLRAQTGETHFKGFHNGQTELYYDGSRKLHTRSDAVNIIGDLDMNDADNYKINIGQGSDLQIFHNGTNSFISNTTGILQIDSDDRVQVNATEFRVKNAGDTETIAKFIQDGAVELYHNNLKKLETFGNGIIVYGPEGGGGLVNLYADEGDDNADKWRIHANPNGSFYLQNYTSGSWENNLAATGNGQTELFYDNVKRFETTSLGATVFAELNIAGSSSGTSSGTAKFKGYRTVADNGVLGELQFINQRDNDVQAKIEVVADGDTNAYFDVFASTANNRTFRIYDGSVAFPDTNKLMLGSGNDLQIYHESGYNIINTNTAGNLDIKNGSEYIARFAPNGNNELFYDNSKKLETKSAGIKVTGIPEFRQDSTVTDFTNLSAPGANNSGCYVQNVGATTGNFAAFSAIAHSGNSVGMSASFIAKSHATGYSPEVYITQRDGGNSQRTAIKITNPGAVELNHAGTKKFETTSSGAYVTGQLTVDGGTNTYIYLKDSDHGDRAIHTNADKIGFLKQDSNWGAYCDDSGNWVAEGNVTAYSDARLKTDISTINDALGIVGKLRGVSYKWSKDGSDGIGVIAQEVEEVIPSVVVTNKKPGLDGMEEVKSVDYGKIVGVLINAINELKAEVDELKGGK